MSKAIFATLLVVVLADLTGSNAWMVRHRDATVFEPYPDWSQVARDELQRRDDIKAKQRLPLERVRIATTDVPDTGLSNKGFLLSLPSLSYFSSVMPNATLILGDHLGITSGITARNQSQSVDAVANSIMGVAAEFDPGTSTELLPPVPFATLSKKGATPEEPVYGGISVESHPKRNVFTTREDVLGADIYREADKLTFFTVDIQQEDGSFVAGTQVTGHCPSNMTVIFDGREFRETIHMNGNTQRVYHDVLALPQAQDAEGNFSFSLAGDVEKERSSLRGGDRLACFDEDLYRHTVASFPRYDTEVSRRGEVSIRVDRPLTGTLVLKMPVIEGYYCESAGNLLPLASLHGLVAINVNNVSELSCQYEIPWQRHAWGVSLAALLCSGVYFFTRRLLNK